MARRRLNRYAKGPEGEEARVLAKKVFMLKEKLGISYEQMAKETGLTISSLRTLKSVWVNQRKEVNRMFPSVANKLIDFWNAHLVNGKHKSVKSQKKKGKIKKRKAQKLDPQIEINEDVLAILIKKAGLPQAQELLKARGKETKLQEFLAGLSPEELADLV